MVCSALVALFGALAVSTRAADIDLVRTVDGGQIKGWVPTQKVQQYNGIPFAAPPTGSNRWKPPQPIIPWKGVRDASKFSNDCVQSGESSAEHEDCLYLNVFAPINATANQEKPYAVMLWWYGGSWTSGGDSLFLYDGAWDVAVDNDIIIVTSNYRLNVFGFLGSEALASRTPDGSFGNYGIQDQRAAMVWVKNNIAAFGGDPNNVLIYGESAGAGSVSNHLVMEKSFGLYERALMESGPEARWTAQTADQAECHFSNVLYETGCRGGDAAEQVACLLALNTTTLFEGGHHAPACFLPVPKWSPVVDGVELTERPEFLAKAGKINGEVQVLLGTNHDEGTMFFSPSRNSTLEEVIAYFDETFGNNLGTIAITEKKLYNVEDYESAWWMGSHILGDTMMSCAARRTARWAEAAGASVYLYFWDHIPFIFRSRNMGVFHGSELFSVFHITPLLQGPGEPLLADQFVDYWTNFARTGNPNTFPEGRSNTNGVIDWPQYSAKTDENIILNITLGTQSGLKATVCDFWDTVIGDIAPTHTPIAEEL